jgi:hypothetical protein
MKFADRLSLNIIPKIFRQEVFAGKQKTPGANIGHTVKITFTLNFWVKDF